MPTGRCPVIRTCNVLSRSTSGITSWPTSGCCGGTPGAAPPPARPQQPKCRWGLGAPRIVARFASLAGVLHALPLAYSKDLQEDKEALFDAVDNLELCLEAAERMLAGLSFDRERLAAAAGDELLAATDIADLLVRRGMPFREAHAVVAGLVREALERDKLLSEMTPEDLARHSELLDDSYYELLRSGG